MASSGGGLPIVAIVGRPNVGKSTLFNRIVGERTAIVEDRARTTRDRLYAEAEWNGRSFLLVDTGGLEAAPDDPIEASVQVQARIAIREADVIVLVVDSMSGMTPADTEAAELLRRAKAPVLVAANKSDNAARELEAAEFWSLGWDRTLPIAAIHGRGVADLLDEIVAALPPTSSGALDSSDRETPSGETPDGTETSVTPSIALVGRPNVGKSSLLNALLGEERMIVSDVPGTTRDSIDTRLSWGRGEVVLIDTAGIKRRGKVASGPAAERFSTLRSLRAISRADVAVLLVDAVDGLTAQDAHIAGYVVEEGRGLVVALNKWDVVEDKTGQTFDQYVGWIRGEVPFLDFAPVVSISAKTGQRIDRVLELAVDVWGERRRRIPTAELNRVVQDALARQDAPMVKGRRPKLFYATQASIEPPTFVFFARDAGAVHFSYERYLENRLRDAFGFDGTPIRLVFRERTSAEPTGRRHSRGRAPAVAGGRR
ncbi:MAG TPA: ribosome biogenesis GTPase Der [Candidatus Limnocylindrales bacterium]|nr:ribosome biogenesis GTPase Der [Candidatus Limnocylindrales bacterium]